MLKIILIMILLSTISCKTVELWSSKDGTENKSCFVDGSCKDDLICNNENICVKQIALEEKTEVLTTNIPINKDVSKDTKKENNDIIKKDTSKNKINNNSTSKEENITGDRKLGSKCNSTSDCDGSICIKYRKKEYRCSKKCKKDKDCPTSISTCHNWIHECINDDN